MEIGKQLSSKQKITKYQLGQYQLNDQISQQATKRINYIKSKNILYANQHQWQKHQNYKKDLSDKTFKQNVIREDYEHLNIQQFVQKYQKKKIPIVITGVTKNWNTSFFDFKNLYNQYKNTKFKIAEDEDGIKLKLEFKYYLEYLLYNQDDNPLYLFENQLHQTLPQIFTNYEIPKFFRDDLMGYAQSTKRPPYRWLLIGPQRSGSLIHIDPNCTSAWNTSLYGHKRWVLFPEYVPKQIVKGKIHRQNTHQDEPLIYFKQILPKIIEKQGRQNLGIIQFIQNPGETVFIPGGWWHAVLNLDDTIAITQNMMTHANFDDVWKNIVIERKEFAKLLLMEFKKKNMNLYTRALQLINFTEIGSVSLSDSQQKQRQNMIHDNIEQFSEKFEYFEDQSPNFQNEVTKRCKSQQEKVLLVKTEKRKSLQNLQKRS